METDFIVVGAGVAGLRAAIELAEAGRVLVISKLELEETATQYAQGGVAVALSDEDEIGLHLQDTLAAGDGLVDEAAARVLVEEGQDRIQELIDWGTQFDRTGTRLTFTREAAHSRNRILHAHGDSTGREIGRALAARAHSLPNITFAEYEFTADLLLEDGRAAGVYLIDRSATESAVRASAILLATGGAGQVYRDTTNPSVATADGIAMAYRAGATVSDMEFVQFHPTALYLQNAPRFLLSEALRGEGAHLLNPAQERFMAAYHPMAELAPRDVVARAITAEIDKTRSGDTVCYLDLRHLDAARVATRFPRIHATCLRHGLDITRDLIPVRPAAHYIMGGVKTDLWGQTTVPGLFAAGETACTGVHGANRLASNSLLEGLVYGARAGRRMRASANAPRRSGPAEPRPLPPLGNAMSPDQMIQTVKNIMARNAGVTRTGEGLKEALCLIDTLANRLPKPNSRISGEAFNLQQVAWLIIKSALKREESRGAHYRTDFPRHDGQFKKHSLVRNGIVSFA
ncbi:MAG: L-aspartate oxidase [Acidobacteriales bacterium]|nr:L-aspartate oxidase [Terriglobales bacterium]